MTKKLLVIASSLLFIVGCGSELDRCMKANEIAISLDGRGRWMENVFIERPVV